ncbi:ATPase, T2SS/T4P/T4SS family [uncultured Ilyobacter sp.]|uniref:GspE/PulE family protein n=1 Tax=uncultured Ilyobacter sp. TaxID=544433 RepID=UPI0029C7C9D2|nr:ATPase, T2SS/T4P/T4SS family [uncultured Ilyobacter sp.]
MVVVRKRKSICERLKEKNILTQEQIDEAIRQQGLDQDKKIGQILLDLGYISEDKLLKELSDQLGVKSKVIRIEDINKEAMSFFDRVYLEEKNVVPIGITSNKIIIAMADPTDVNLIDEINLKTKLIVSPYLALEDNIKDVIHEYLEEKTKKTEAKVEGVFAELQKSLEDDFEFLDSRLEDIENRFDSESAPIIRGVDALLMKAIRLKSSDIHIEPYEDEIRVRYRIDGVLVEIKKMPKNLIYGLVSRIKIMAGMDIAEKRLPQDGRFRIKIAGRSVDFRVSTLPTIYGEKIVMRILDKSNMKFDLDGLGFKEDAMEIIKKKITSPYGIILVTGPTGSGKSTTLYSMLKSINTDDVNISTVEDPVEYELKGINQVHCKNEIGLNFANALRTFLRQDPDIIMVGEIRDNETAQIAIKAALTGHLVFSTLHTNDAPSSIHRLIDMGVEPFLISASLLMIQAQRLVRKICPHCKAEHQDPKTLLKSLGEEPSEYENITFYKGKGCAYCNGTGYTGRSVIYEVMPLTDELKEAVGKRLTTMEIREISRREGMVTLRETGIKKAVLGETTLEEIIRVTLM